MSAFAFAFLIAGINGIGHGQGPPFVAVELIGAVVVGTLLVRRQARLILPLLPVDLFKRPVFALSVAASVSTFVAQGIVFVTLPFYFQDVLGRSQVATGLLLTPWPVTVAIIAPIAGRLADRYPAGILGGIGLGVLSLGFVLMAVLPAQPGTADIVWRMTVCGLGFGFFQSPNNRAIVSSAPRERSGGAGAIQSTARLLGQTIGAALVALIFGIAGPSGGTSPTVAILLAAGFSAIGGGGERLSPVQFRAPDDASSRRRRGPAPRRARHELSPSTREADSRPCLAQFRPQPCRPSRQLRPTGECLWPSARSLPSGWGRCDRGSHRWTTTTSSTKSATGSRRSRSTAPRC